MHNTINVDDWCDGIETCDQCTPYVQMQSAFAKIYAVAILLYVRRMFGVYIFQCLVTICVHENIQNL